MITAVRDIPAFLPTVFEGFVFIVFRRRSVDSALGQVAGVNQGDVWHVVSYQNSVSAWAEGPVKPRLKSLSIPDELLYWVCSLLANFRYV